MNKYFYKFLAASAMIFSYLIFIKWRKENPIELDIIDIIVPIFCSMVITAGDMFWDRWDAKKKKS